MLPFTTVKVYLAVEKETTIAGPYARYAQRFLGVIAPLADRKTYRIISARLDYTDPHRKLERIDANDPQSGVRAVSHVFGGNSFTRVPPDRVTSSDRSSETMARDAAQTIFALRRQRLEILTGDAAELYSGGLEATFAELSRVEDEYLALFMGKQSVTTTVYEIDIVPTAERTSYIVCRFTAEDGVLASDDLSGEPVTLRLTPERGATPVAAPARNTRGQTVRHRLADFAECKLTYEQTELARRRIPVYQFGIDIDAPVTR